jgi:hypothetical protein
MTDSLSHAVIVGYRQKDPFGLLGRDKHRSVAMMTVSMLVVVVAMAMVLVLVMLVVLSMVFVSLDGGLEALLGDTGPVGPKGRLRPPRLVEGNEIFAVPAV